MSPSSDNHWTPTRELLAAFADGELDCRPELDWMRRRIETWLAAHPEAAAALEAQITLSRLMGATRPPEPEQSVWDIAWTHIEKGRMHQGRPRPAARWRLAGVAVAGLAAAIAVMVMMPRQEPGEGPNLGQVEVVQVPPGRRDLPEAVEVLHVVRADEVEILQVAGADAATLVAGHLPWLGPMVLVKPDEVAVKSPVNDVAGMELRLGSGSTPIIWMLLPGDKDDEL